MHIFGESIGPNIEFCRPNSTSVENQFCRAKNMGGQNGRGRIEIETNSAFCLFIGVLLVNIDEF